MAEVNTKASERVAEARLEDLRRQLAESQAHAARLREVLDAIRYHSSIVVSGLFGDMDPEDSPDEIRSLDVDITRAERVLAENPAASLDAVRRAAKAEEAREIAGFCASDPDWQAAILDRAKRIEEGRL